MAPVTGIVRSSFLALLVFTCVCGGSMSFSIDSWPSLAGRLRLVGDSSDREGVVETFIYDEWRMVCGQNWSLEPAHMVCRQLGYAGGAVEAQPRPTPPDLFAEPVLVDLVSCVGGRAGEFTDCDEYVSSGDDWCNPFNVAWVRCAEEPLGLFQSMPQSEALNMESATASTGVKPRATDVGDGSVTLDWADWYRAIDGDSLFLIRFVIKYRVADNDASMEYEIAAEPRSYETRNTISGLRASTRYEFIVEGVMLGPGGEELGPATKPLLIIMPCGAPSQVSNPKVRPRNGTGRVLQLSWDSPSGPECPASSYIVKFQQGSVGQCEEVGELDSASMAGSTTLTHFTLGGLQPYSTYTVYVTSRNRYGISETWQETVMTNEDVPSAAPANIRAEYLAGTTLRVSWDPIPCRERGGVITGYTYILLDLTSDTVTHNGHTTKTSIELPDSHAVRRYKFLVAARTVAGHGPSAAFSVDAQPKLHDICGMTAPYDLNRALKSGEIIQKISSGTAALKGSAPWLAQLWYVDRGTLFCHGSILDNRWILTAAHCIRDRNATKDDIMVRLGDYDKNLPETEEQVFRVQDIRVHQNFDTEVFNADVAVIKLERSIEFTDYVRPICLPSKTLSKSMLTVGKYGVVSGWGKVSRHDTTYPRHLKRVDLPVKGQDVCRDSTDFKVTSNMFCAGYKTAGKGDACEGDSGAPFVVRHSNDRWYILGVVSWGEGCDKADKYGFYVRLHRYTAWLRKQTGIKLS